jgi:hypothetical protein
MLRIQMIIGAVSVLLLGIVFELIRRGRLREKYALLWLLSGVVIVIFSVFPNLLAIISMICSPKLGPVIDTHAFTVIRPPFLVHP